MVELDIDALMSAPPSAETGRKILEWVEDLDGRILRGDLMLGILAPEVVEKVPAALRRATECGEDEAWLRLAEWFEGPPLDDPDFAAADEVLGRAVARGIDEADLALARLRWFRRREEASGSEKAQALELVKARVERDEEDDEALYLLGLMTCAGFGTTADPAVAFELQKRAAALENEDAHFELYVHLSTGLGVAKDEQAALSHVEKAAEAGHPRAAYNMGAFLATGRYGKKDSARAAQWYQEACDAGNAKACATLGAMYATGDGVERDAERARELFDEAEYDGFDTSAIKDAIGWEDEDEEHG